MSLAIAPFCSSNPSLKPPHFALNLFPQSHLSGRDRKHVVPFRSFSTRRQSFVPDCTPNSGRFSARSLGFSMGRKRGFRASAENREGESKIAIDEAEEAARGESTMPERFRPLTKEAPNPPVRWPWFVALAFLLYSWRTVLWELSNWKKVVASAVRFVGYLLKLALALVFHFIGDPITSLIRGIETTIYTIRAFYSSVVAYTPVPELTLIIILVSSILAIAEASVPNSVDSQPYLLTVAGIIGFAAVRSLVSELFFWMLLLGLFGFARFVKKRDYVSSILPIASVLVAVGEPWVRIVVMGSYVALAITHHFKRQFEDKDGGEKGVTGRKVPMPLLWAALAIGVHVAAKWAGRRHLTWMIV
ncbi:hypothetical protein U1Q18_024583 [Sarracenia purpurea var. burkii]